MLTDAQIAGMTPDQRRELINRLAAPVAELAASPSWMRRTREVRLGLMVLSALLLVPWIAYLAVSLPHRYVAHNWDLAWIGFDILLFVLLSATALLGYLRRQLVMLTAFATGVVLVCDAWFDVMTSDGAERAWSAGTALLVELPLAVLLIAGALQLLRVIAARQWALDPGGHAWEVTIPLPSDAERRTRSAASRLP